MNLKIEGQHDATSAPTKESDVRVEAVTPTTASSLSSPVYSHGRHFLLTPSSRLPARSRPAK